MDERWYVVMGIVFIANLFTLPFREFGLRENIVDTQYPNFLVNTLLYLIAGKVIAWQFPESYDFWLVQFAWTGVNSAWLSFEQIVPPLSMVAGLFLITDLLGRIRRFWARAIGTISEQLTYALGGVSLGILLLMSVYCVFVALFATVTRAIDTPPLIYIYFLIILVFWCPWYVRSAVRFVRHLREGIRLPLSSLYILVVTFGAYVPFLSKFLGVYHARGQLMVDFPDRDRVGDMECIEPKRMGVHRILIFSDTHFVSPGDEVIGSSPLRTQHETGAFIRDSIESLRPDLVIHAGDVTDKGESEGWDIARAVFENSCPTIIAPGNHDFHFRRFLKNSDSKESFDDSDVLGYMRPIVAPFFGKKHRFPILHRLSELDLVVLVLNSNRRLPSTVITNAIGKIGDDQIFSAQKLINKHKRPTDRLIIVAHHHVVVPRFGLPNVFLRCIDSEQILSLAIDNNAIAIINGHKHMPYVHEYRKKWIKESPYIYKQIDYRAPIISCGSAHHKASGPNREKVGVPSCYLMTIDDERVREVSLISDHQGNGGVPSPR